MGTVPVPRTWNVRDLDNAALMNAEVRDVVNWMLNKPRCLLRKSASQSIHDNSSTVAVTWDVEDEEIDLTHAASSTDIVVNTPGLYMVIANVEFPASGTVGQRRVDIFVNGGSPTGNVFASENSNPPGNVITRLSAKGWRRAVVGDVFNVYVYQSSGSAQSISANCNFSAIFMQA